MRLANLDDAKILFDWQSHPKTREYFFDPTPPTWEEHWSWLLATLSSKNRFLLIAEERGPIGVLRYDLQNDLTAAVDIYLKPGLYGKGLGTQVLKAGNQWIKHQLPNIQKLIAKVIPTNVASSKAFQKAGFSLNYFVYEIGL